MSLEKEETVFVVFVDFVVEDFSFLLFCCSR